MEWYLKSHVSVDADHVEMGQQEFCKRSAAIGMLLSAKPHTGFFLGMEREQHAIRAPGLKPTMPGHCRIRASSGRRRSRQSFNVATAEASQDTNVGRPVADKTHCIFQFLCFIESKCLPRQPVHTLTSIKEIRSPHCSSHLKSFNIVYSSRPYFLVSLSSQYLSGLQDASQHRCYRSGASSYRRHCGTFS